MHHHSRGLDYDFDCDFHFDRSDLYHRSTETTTTAPPPEVTVPAELFIPAYGGNPDVGLSSPGSISPYTGPNTIRETTTIDPETQGVGTVSRRT